MPHLKFPRAGRPGALFLALGVLAVCVGCRGTRTESAGTHVSQGDVLSGRLAPQYPRHAFSFEGVESSLLDFTLQSDELNRSAPAPALTGPDGATIDLTGHRMSPEGAATTRYEGIVLMRTGVYRLAVESSDRSDDSWYLYRHAMRFPSIVDDRARLTAAGNYPISFSAPYGGTVSVRVQPIKGSPLQPELRGVIDPNGGRALDPGATPGGVQPPQQAPTIDGGVLLMFVAPRGGRYTVLAAAKPGHEGDASISVDVTPPSFDRAVWHPGSDPLGSNRTAMGQPSAPSIGGAPMMQPAMQPACRTTAVPAPPPPVTAAPTASTWSTPPAKIPPGR